MGVYDDLDLLDRVDNDLQASALRFGILLPDASYDDPKDLNAEAHRCACVSRIPPAKPDETKETEQKRLQSALAKVRAERVELVIQGLHEWPESWNELAERLTVDADLHDEGAKRSLAGTWPDETREMYWHIQKSSWYWAANEGDRVDIATEVLFKILIVVVRNARVWHTRNAQEGGYSWWGFVARQLPQIIARTARQYGVGKPQFEFHLPDGLDCLQAQDGGDIDRLLEYSGLTSRESAVILARHMEGFNVEETASQLGLTQSLVRDLEKSASRKLDGRCDHV